MPGPLSRILWLSRTRQGRRAIAAVRRAAADPRRQEQARRLLRRLGGRR